MQLPGTSWCNKLIEFADDDMDPGYCGKDRGELLGGHVMCSASGFSISGNSKGLFSCSRDCEELPELQRHIS